MIFRQLFDQTSGTYSYLLASRRGGEAMIIDPVIEKVDRYLALVKELDLKLVKAAVLDRISKLDLAPLNEAIAETAAALKDNAGRSVLTFGPPPSPPRSPGSGG